MFLAQQQQQALNLNPTSTCIPHVNHKSIMLEHMQTNKFFMVFAAVGMRFFCVDKSTENLRENDVLPFKSVTTGGRW